MNDIGAAEFLAQNVVRRADVEDQHIGRGRNIGGADQRAGREVRDHELDALPGEVRQSRRGVLAGLQATRDEAELLAEKFAGDIVVVDARQRASLAVIGGGQLQPRHRRTLLRAAQIADPDRLDRLGRIRAGGSVRRLGGAGAGSDRQRRNSDGDRQQQPAQGCGKTAQGPGPPGPAMVRIQGVSLPLAAMDRFFVVPGEFSRSGGPAATAPSRRLMAIASIGGGPIRE